MTHHRVVGEPNRGTLPVTPPPEALAAVGGRGGARAASGLKYILNATANPKP